MPEKAYVAIDLKSFYASVEAVERGLNPLTVNLVVADLSRTEKTICLAVSPALKEYGIGGRARLFEVVQRVREINEKRRLQAPGGRFTGKSADAQELARFPELELDYVVAPPRMAYYMEYSKRIYQIYLQYVSAEDMHVYSIDEVFMDVTNYLHTYHMTVRQLTERMVHDVLAQTGITATAGIGTNLYLAKIAMDIEAKHIEPDEHGVRIAQLDERSYRQRLWQHQPITDFWRVGRGYAKRLAEHGMYTMGDVARCSIGRPGNYYNEELLYQLFGINAELLIDHAWGWEPCTIQAIHEYQPDNRSISSGQVLQRPYDWSQARLVAREMADLLSLDLVDKGLLTDQMVLTVGYDRKNLDDQERAANYHGTVKKDRYGRRVPRQAHGSKNIGCFTSSTHKIMDTVTALYEEIVDKNLLVRRITLVANHVEEEDKRADTGQEFEQLELFTDYEARDRQRMQEEEALAKERRMQQAVLSIKKRYGKNAILKGMNLQKDATAQQRNEQIGGHKA